MRYTGIQPQYFPRLHYFARILNTDIFLIRDDVQFVAKHKYPDGKTGWSYQVHTPLKAPDGLRIQTVPVTSKSFQPIVETKATYEHTWVSDHLKSIQFLYSRAPNFHTIYKLMEAVLQKQHSSIAELNIASTLWAIAYLLEIPVTSDKVSIGMIETALAEQPWFRLRKIRRGSESKVFRSGESLHPTEKIIRLCQEFGATEDYCGGTSISAYLDQDNMKKNGIRITVQNWVCREYPQLFSAKQPFIPNLSIIDLLMNVSPKEAREILASND